MLSRTRVVFALVFFGAAACSFGVDLDGLTGGAAPTTPHEAGVADAKPPVAESGPPIAQATPSTAAIVQLAAGNQFTCVRRSDGSVNCWGSNTQGRLGDGTTASSSKPVVVANVDSATELAVGANHACVLLQNGSVQCWGANESGQLGNGTANETHSPSPVVGLSGTAKHIAAGGVFSCAHMADDTAMCWGDDAHGELGNGSTGSASGPVAVKGVTGIRQLAVAAATACALVSDGSVWCWGYDADGELGNGTFGTDAPTPAAIPNGAPGNVQSIVASGTSAHFCAVQTTGAVACWGENESGALGDGSKSDQSSPVGAMAITDATAVAVGANYTFAIHRDGSVSSWGTNGAGTLAVDGSSTAPTPASAPSLSGVTAIAAGGGHACALKDPSTVLCWGSDEYGALGRGRALVAPTPVLVSTAPSDGGIRSLALGRAFGCYVDEGGTLACWGENANRQQARSDFDVSGEPQPVPNVTGSTTVSTGDTHTCVTSDSNPPHCWGEGDHGELGNGATTSTASPVTFGSPAASNVGAGAGYTCALTGSNQVWCSGANPDGRVGRSTSQATSFSTPAAVMVPITGDGGVDAGVGPLSDVDSISVGRDFACAVYATKTKLACWGNNSDGQLGTSGGNRSLPENVNVTSTLSGVRAGTRHACALFSSGSLACWGRNANGQITGTDPSSTSSLRTVSLSGKGVRSFAVGDDHTCAVLDDGSTWCWGAGTQGQLGNGQLEDSNVPVEVPGITGARSIAAAENHTCAVTATGLYCWGDDYAGELGVSALMQTGAPAPVQGL